VNVGEFSSLSETVFRSPVGADVVEKVGWNANWFWRERLDVGSRAAREGYMCCRTSIFSRTRERIGVRKMGRKSEQEIGCAILGIRMIVELSHWLGTTKEETEWEVGEAMERAASLKSQEGRRSGPAAVGRRWSRE